MGEPQGLPRFRDSPKRLINPRARRQSFGFKGLGAHLDVDESHVIDGGEALHELAARLVLLGDELPDHGPRRGQVEEVPDGDRDAAVRQTPLRQERASRASYASRASEDVQP